MNLVNFSPIVEMSEPGWGIALHALGVKWDLHNTTGFEGFVYSVSWTEAASLTLKWRNFEGLPVYPCVHFCLVFTNVDYLEVAPRDPEMPMDEDATLGSFGCIEAEEDSDGYRDGWIPAHDLRQGDTPFHLVFRFRGGQFIRVGAEKAEFVLLEE